MQPSALNGDLWWAICLFFVGRTCYIGKTMMYIFDQKISSSLFFSKKNLQPNLINFFSIFAGKTCEVANWLKFTNILIYKSCIIFWYIKRCRFFSMKFQWSLDWDNIRVIYCWPELLRTANMWYKIMLWPELQVSLLTLQIYQMTLYIIQQTLCSLCLIIMQYTIHTLPIKEPDRSLCHRWNYA